MKLNDLYINAIGDMVKEMKIVNIKIHSDNVGCLKGVEIIYVPSDAITESDVNMKGGVSPF